MKLLNLKCNRFRLLRCEKLKRLSSLDLKNGHADLLLKSHLKFQKHPYTTKNQKRKETTRKNREWKK